MIYVYMYVSGNWHNIFVSFFFYLASNCFFWSDPAKSHRAINNSDRGHTILRLGKFSFRLHGKKVALLLFFKYDYNGRKILI